MPDFIRIRLIVPLCLILFAASGILLHAAPIQKLPDDEPEEPASVIKKLPDEPEPAATVITNYDRIINMTPEELAVFIAENAGCEWCQVRVDPECDQCAGNWLDWLKQECAE